VTSTEVSYYAVRNSDNLKLASYITNLQCCHALDLIVTGDITMSSRCIGLFKSYQGSFNVRSTRNRMTQRNGDIYKETKTEIE
jgi:hypothetical protein